MSSTENWKAFSLTHVEYISGDYVGLFLALCSLLPIAIIIAFITLILFRRDVHTIFFFIGVTVCEGINLVLKVIFAQPRPHYQENLYTEYGMPSSHSQLMWFFCTYCLLFIVFRLRHNHDSILEIIWKAFVGVELIVAAFLVSYSRIYLLYHTWMQVLGGFVAGSSLGCGWFFLVHIGLAPYFPIIASWQISELLMIRDTSLIPNILWFEYTNSRAENRARNRKLVSMKSQ